jgi:hypothetical protein
MVVNPYTDNQLNPDERIRVFEVDTNDEELVWHRDKRNRKVEVLEGKGWMFQYENGLPFPMEVGDTLDITKKEYHRIIKGDTSLKIKITEYGR